jgi:hypothetical protein
VKITDPENIRQAYREARRGKSRLKIVHWCAENLDMVTETIRRRLTDKTYKTAPYSTMFIHEPKTREIFKLPFYPDRIIHHALMRVVEPIWNGLFFHDSHACRKGKGIHAGSRKTMEYVRRYRYCLKMDISKFYPSVDHDILYDIVKHKIKCRDTLWLIHEIIYSAGGGKNVPIGNYTSQWLGNLYMNELDNYLKQDLKVRAYVRYCDDFCVFHNDKRYLGALAENIKFFLAARLKLTLSKCDLFPVSRGVDFLGYRHFPDYVLLRKSTATRIKRRLRTLPLLLAKQTITPDQYRSTLASISGWLRWANTRHLQLTLDMKKLSEVAANGNGRNNEGAPTIQGFREGPCAPGWRQAQN